jgi:MFS family permease
LSVIGTLVLRRTGYRMPLYVGGATIAAGMLLLAFRPGGTIPPYVWLAGSALLVGAGAGAINPASRNAGLQLAPRQSSTLAALRSASLQIGSITTVSIVTAIIASSDDPGRAQAWVFAAAGLLLAAALPLIRRVPEQRGAW